MAQGTLGIVSCTGWFRMVDEKVETLTSVRPCKSYLPLHAHLDEALLRMAADLAWVPGAYELGT